MRLVQDSLQNRRDFLRISGEQRRKRGERVASASCVRGEERTSPRTQLALRARLAFAPVPLNTQKSRLFCRLCTRRILVPRHTLLPSLREKNASCTRRILQPRHTLLPCLREKNASCTRRILQPRQTLLPCLREKNASCTRHSTRRIPQP